MEADHGAVASARLHVPNDGSAHSLKWGAMGKIRIGYGSEWHLLTYLGRYRARLTTEVAAVTRGQDVDWLDWPRSSAPVEREWRGIDFIRDHPVRDAWSSFCPQRGNSPNWDAIGTADIDGKTTWLLVEAKAHSRELRS